MKTQAIKSAAMVVGVILINLAFNQHGFSQDDKFRNRQSSIKSAPSHYKSTRKSSSNVRIARPAGVSFSLGGGAGLGVSIDYFVLPELSLEAGFGASQYVAVKYHFLGRQDDRRWSPFIGLAYCWPTCFNSDGISLRVISAPVGIHLIARSGFSFSISLAVSYVYARSNEFWTDDYGEFFPIPMPGIRIGYHF